ncbi:acetyl-CoA C-acetyltransferase [endosymbiont of Ridgeia piscesae]|jgi:acetyl-CoA C-acetyltransferase|uniref:3-ketoacyl-CoA thiolase n=1 Tax=endosymbiont of Ridgeia piscesae TaxID=54398 RepID=A0A0T5YYS8_9GAMM|nr:acetyl-CoA C-acetyltransferase [endosymbiont of Ridgeia piscesae]KRT55422.1 3-ketoacyl-CoA thiolase [endosymbiont of Ridgeia piscesae]KRT56931.1 3-ketoacyl-CoA thiolase [endosymbiont of Ridgeia piscesae]
MEQRDSVCQPVYIIDGSRTPFLKARGTPGPFSASDLAVAAGRPLLARQARLSPAQLDQVILGCVGPGPDEANIGRLLALRLDCGKQVPGWTVQRNCASGLQAVDSAAIEIASGRAELILAGGSEAMSRQPLLLNMKMVGWLAQWQRSRGLIARSQQLSRLRPAHFQLIIALLRGLTDPTVGLSMGQTAENLATRFSIDRERMDRFALASHRRLQQAMQEARLDEIEPLFDHQGRLYDHDDGLRADSSLEKLATLKAVFDPPYGRVSAGNSAQISDGAALLLLASEHAVERFQLQPMGRLIDSHWAALDPAQMGLGPVHAMAPLLQRNQLESDQIDAWEINEAFAVQVLACLAAWQDGDYLQRELGIEQPMAPIFEERLNRNGGAIAIGHPVGASGARLVLHLLKRLQQEGGQFGIASLCIGGGQGGAILVERV